MRSGKAAFDKWKRTFLPLGSARRFTVGRFSGSSAETESL
jgi:hypothetical protein